MCDEPTRFEVGKSKYPWPAHWRGVAFNLGGFDFALTKVSVEYMTMIYQSNTTGLWSGLPSVYSVKDGMMEVYPVPDRGLDMAQAAERPKITRGMLALKW